MARSSGTGGNNSEGWASAQVLQVVSEMKVPVSTSSSLLQSQQPYRSQSDPRLGSVWVVRVALSPYIKNPVSTGTDKNHGQNHSADGPCMAEFFQGGDLLLIHCSGFERYCTYVTTIVQFYTKMHNLIGINCKNRAEKLLLLARLRLRHRHLHALLLSNINARTILNKIHVLSNHYFSFFLVSFSFFSGHY